MKKNIVSNNFLFAVGELCTEILQANGNLYSQSSKF